MRVACVLTAADLDQVDGTPDVIVLPEGVKQTEIETASKKYPEAVVVGAVEEGSRMRGWVLHKRRNHIEYLKFGPDGRHEGTFDEDQNPVVHFSELGFSVGVLICLDIGHSNEHVNTFPFSNKVLVLLRGSHTEKKLLCVPADMNKDWENMFEFKDRFKDINVALCNNVKTYSGDSRLKSFITNTDVNKTVIQRNIEPIYYDL